MEGTDVEVQSTLESNKKGKYLTWTPEMDGVLLEVLKEQKAKGQKQDRNFSQEAYKAAIDALNMRFGKEIKVENVINRLKTLKTQMYKALDILNKSGFAWNDIGKTIEAEGSVWDQAIEAKPEVRLVRGKQLFNLHLMRDIYEKDRATGLQAESAKEKVKRWQDEAARISIEEIDQLQTDSSIHIESFYQGNEVNQEESNQAPSFSAYSASKNHSVRKRGIKRKALVEDVFSEGIKDVKEAMKDIALAIKSSNPIANPEEVVKMLQEMGLEGDFFLDALDYLMADPIHINTFRALPTDLHQNWLFKKIGNQFYVLL